LPSVPSCSIAAGAAGADANLDVMESRVAEERRAFRIVSGSTSARVMAGSSAAGSEMSMSCGPGRRFALHGPKLTKRSTACA